MEDIKRLQEFDRNHSFSSTLTPILRNIDLEIKCGELICVVGPVGSGKSSLLAAILGEIQCWNGEVKMMLQGSKAYFPQQPWIQNATVRDNILFGALYDKARFEAVLDAVCLGPDLDLLPAGIETEVGEKGINLSGGQKARIALARCFYSASDLVLLDDPLSALDSHVARTVMEKGIVQWLKGRTRILCTHALQFLPYSDRIVVMNSGQIVEIGTYKELTAKGLFLQQENSKLTPSTNLEDSELDSNQSLMMMISSTRRLTNRKGTLTEVEEREVGSITFSVVRYYLQSTGHPFLLGFLFFYGGARAFQTFTDLVLMQWSLERTPGNKDVIYFYFFILTIIATFTLLFTTLSTLSTYFSGAAASKTIHHNLVHSLLKAPINFFDSTPLGRIINRFTKDMYVIFFFSLFLNFIFKKMLTIIFLISLKK
jgi:ABC-type multidrug transport system fused ATPase/permease subunit